MTVLEQLLQDIQRLSPAEKAALRERLDADLAASIPASDGVGAQSAQFGWARGLVEISSDFDEPLPGFEDYSA